MFSTATLKDARLYGCSIVNAKFGGNLPCENARNLVLVQGRGLLAEVLENERFGTSGNDCRAAIMKIQ